MQNKGWKGALGSRVEQNKGWKEVVGNRVEQNKGWEGVVGSQVGLGMWYGSSLRTEVELYVTILLTAGK